MAIEKMKLIGITGNSKDLDKFLANVLFKSDLQIEDAKNIYNKGWKLEYYNYDYKIKETLKKCENLLNKIGIEYTEEAEVVLLENIVQDIEQKIEEIENNYNETINLLQKNQKEKQETIEKIEEISKIQDLDINIKKLYDLQYIKFRYGIIPKANLEEIKKEIENLNTILFEIKQEKNISWIMYFTTTEYVSSIDGLFNIQKFERKLLPDDLLNTPNEYMKNLREKIRQNEFNIEGLNSRIEKIKSNAMTEVLGYYRELQTYDKINTIKKYIVHDQNDTFYIAAWVPETSLNEIKSKLEELKNIDYVIEDGENPPTKLKNNKIIKPFEELVKMYGMPNINELDPTWFVALTTFIMFGFMFGDVGHGLVFMIIGIIFLIKKQKVYGSILFRWRTVSTDIWNFIWKCIWKRRYNKTNFNKSNK